jgi:hypothetical protein
MKVRSITCAAVATLSCGALLVAAPAHADFGIGINVSNIGFGVEGRQTLSPSFDLRFGISGIRYNLDFEYDDTDYDVEQSMAVPEVKLDWRPGQGVFRMTLGLAYYNQVSQADLVVNPTDNYNIGNGVYTGAELGSLNGKVSYHVGAPYFGVGWDFLPKGKNLGFTVDVGGYYRNKPDVWLYSTDPLSTPGLATDVQIEANNIENDVWTFDPVVRLGMLFRF